MGWKLSIIKDAASAIAAADHALKTASSSPLFNPRKLIIHTDQGSAYLANETIRFWLSYQEILTILDAEKSISHFFKLYAYSGNIRTLIPVNTRTPIPENIRTAIPENIRTHFSGLPE